MIRQKFMLSVMGCDASTEVELELDTEAREALGFAVAVVNGASSAVCEPTMCLAPVLPYEDRWAFTPCPVCDGYHRYLESDDD